MSLGEFALIDRFFNRPLPERDDVLVGIGDDGAVLRIGASRRLVTSVAGAGTATRDAAGGDPARLGNDAMATALNRLAAAGAQPAWATLALTLAEADERWLAAFSDALFAVADPWSVALIGGDTTRGPFAVTVVGHGLLGDGDAEVEPRIAIDDGIYVSGTLGADLAGTRSMPSTVRVALGRWVRAHGGIAADLSEGLGVALAGLLTREALGTRVALPDLPLAPATRRYLHEHHAWRELARARGDMELCFTLPATAHAEVLAWAAESKTRVTRVARVNDSGAVMLLDGDGQPLPPGPETPGATPS